MKALDTNVLARFFVGRPGRRRGGAATPRRPSCPVRAGVRVRYRLLELEWVMRGFYGLKAEEIARAFRALAGFEHVSIEDRGSVLAALDRV